MTGGLVIRWCAALSILTLLTGCQLFRDDEPRIDRSSGPLADERYQWTADPGIDLLNGPAVPVRAFMESRRDAQTMGSLEYAYPGFDRAVATKPDDGGDIFTNNLRPDERLGPSDAVRVGNNRTHILSIAHDGQNVTAIMCNYRYGLALEEGNGKYESVVRNTPYNEGIDALLLILTAPANESNNALPPQEGSAPAPVVDVFGDWKITGFLSDFGKLDPAFAKAWPTYEADQAKCVEQAPDPPERRAFLKDGEHPRSDFPTSPPSPGWPAPPQ
jgi:hypothetical protein